MWEKAIGPTRSRSGFLASEEGKRVDYREVRAAAFMHTGRDEDWPADLRGMRDAAYAGSGTPRFILVRDGRVLSNVFGASKLGIEIRPMIMKFTR